MIEAEPEYLGDGYSIIKHGFCSRYFGPEWRAEQEDDKGIALSRGLYGKNGKLEQIMKMIVGGRGTRDISRTAHATGRTIRKYRDILRKLLAIEFNCPCGKPSTHMDKCAFKLTGGRKGNYK